MSDAEPGLEWHVIDIEPGGFVDALDYVASVVNSDHFGYTVPYRIYIRKGRADATAVYVKLRWG